MEKQQGFILKNKEGIVKIAFAKLEYVEVINKSVFFYMTDGAVYEAVAALRDFEDEFLVRPEFVKTHRSYLVNLSCVQTIGVHSAVMKNGHSVPIARQRRSQVQDAYLHFLHQSETAPSDVQNAGIVASSDAQNAIETEKPKRPRGPWQILVVDDDSAERTFWAEVLQSHGCIVHLAENGEQAMELAKREHCDCVLLDVMIPGENGFSICEKLRGLTGAPVIFLSCLTEPDKQLEGFAAGGIDYITKDTPVELFWAKISTRIRLAVSDCVQMQFGPLLLDLTGRKAQMEGKELFLTPIEFDILWRLAEYAGHIFTPEEIFGMIWGEQSCEDVQKAQMHISKLRRKLDSVWKEHCFIETVWGQGYRFVPPNG